MAATIAAESALDNLIEEEWFDAEGILINRTDDGAIIVWCDREVYYISSEGFISRRDFKGGPQRVIL